jgi:hypothetical protein
MQCANCAVEMKEMSVEGRLGTPVYFCACTICQAFWFEAFKTLQLSPAATLQLMKFIGDNSSSNKMQIASELRCPECKSKLVETHDMQRTTKFNYWRCPQEHGRFISFMDLLREKDFVHPLSPQQIADLRQTVQTVNCSSCGAPVNIQKNSVCEFCHSPLSMLDMKQPERLIKQLKDAAGHRAGMTDPNLHLELAKARMDGEYSFAGHHETEEGPWWNEAPSSGLVEAGLMAVAKWLTKAGI